MRIAVLSILILWTASGCGSGSGSGTESAAKPDATPAPAPKGKTDAEWTQALLGKWDGQQLLRNAHGSTPVEGVLTLKDGGHAAFDGKSARGQIIWFGSWKVSDGHLTYTVEGSNMSREIPNGTTRSVKLREIDDAELLYIDPNDQRTYSAKRVTGAAPAPPTGPGGKKK
jgi:hypothetical protein